MEFRVLGPLAVLDEGRPLHLGGLRQRVLLALFLSRPGQVVPVDRLIDELWEGAPPNSAATALRVHITRVRAVLEPGRARSSPSLRLPATPPGYRLSLEPDELDAQRFERLVVVGRKAASDGLPAEAAEAFERALGLWRGPPFADTGDLESLRGEVARLGELRAAVLEELMEARLELGESARLVATLEQAVSEHPYRERLTGQLMLALYRSGRQVEALRAYSALRERLLDELGIDPAGSLRDLEEAILQQRPELDRAPVAPGEPRSAEPPPRPGVRVALVGRLRELGVLRSAFADVLAGAKRTVFVVGDAGIGKTALVGAFADEARAAGALVLVGGCDPQPVGPYQPFTEAIRGALRSGSVPELGPLTMELGRLVPELSGSEPAPPSPADDDDRFRLFEAAAAFLRELGRPVVLVVEDLHWADAPTRLLLGHLLSHADAGQLLVAATVRHVALDPGAPLAETISRLVTTGRAERLDLPGIGVGDVEALLRAWAPAAVLARTLAEVDTVHDVTGGNPFFIEQVVRHLTDDRDSGAVDLRALAPEGVRDLVAQRLARMSPVASASLRLASVIGEEFDFDLLTRAGGLGEEEALASVEEALGARLLEERPDAVDRFGFAHAVVRNVIYRSLSASRRTRLHRHVGDALEELTASGPSRIAEVAHHFLEAAPTGVVDKAVRSAQAAADAALTSLAFEDAAAFCTRALALLDGVGHGPMATAKCDLLTSRGRAEVRAGGGGGRATLMGAFDVALGLGDPDRAARAVLAVNRGFFARMGRPDDELIEALGAAIAAQPSGDSPVLADLLATLASELVWADDGDRRFGLSDRALAMAQRSGDRRTLCRVLLLRNLTISVPDTLAERIDECHELMGLADELDDPAVRFQAAFHRSGTAMESGDIGTATEMVDLACDLAGRLRQPALLWQAGFMHTSRLIFAGALEDAERSAKDTFERGRRAHQAGEAFVFLTEQMLEIRRWQGRLAEVIGDVRELAGVDGIDFGYSLVRYLLDAGEEEAALARYREVVDRVRFPPRRDMLAMTTIVNLAYLAAHFGDAERIEPLRDLLAPLAGVFASTTVAKPVGEHFLGLLAGADGDLEQAELLFGRAAAAHDRARAPLFLAETRIEWARVLIEHGRLGAQVDRLLEAARGAALAHGAGLLERRLGALSAKAG